MLAQQFSPKMLKHLKECGFCRKVELTQRPFLQYLSTKVLHINVPQCCRHHNFLLKCWNAYKNAVKTVHTHFLKKVGSFQNSGSSKAWKNKLCSFFKPSSWWKTTQTYLLTKVGFQSVETSNFNNLKKDKLCSFYKLPVWWKINQTHILTKVEALKAVKFQKLANPNFADIVTFLLWWKTNEKHLLTKLRTFHCFETSKDCKGKLCSFYKLSVWWKTIQILLLTKVVASTSRQSTK